MPQNLNNALSASYSVLKTSVEKLPSQQTKKIVDKIRGDVPNWIEAAPLYEVSIRLHALHKLSPRTLTGSDMAQYTKRLIKDEIEPGGPYESGPYDAYLTNYAIERLLSLVGVHLPQLSDYVDRSVVGSVDQEQKIIIRCLKNKPIVTPVDARDTRRYSTFTDTVVERTKIYLSNPDEQVNQLLLDMIKKVREVDVSGEISRLALDFNHSLRKDIRRLTVKHLVDIGVANYCAWIAYAIYDDFIDDEGKAGLLPIANIAHRYSVLKYIQIAQQLGIGEQAALGYFDAVDTGSLKEVTDYKAKIKNGDTIRISKVPDYKDYSFLSERALGYLTGPLLIIELTDAPKKQSELLKKGLSKFLQARQISDDLLDWRSDLSCGRITSVIAILLKDARITPGQYKLPELTRVLSEALLNSTFVSVNQIIVDKVAQAKQDLENSGIVDKNSVFFRQYIQPIANSALAINEDHGYKQDFLNTFVLS